jgi:hypothetical protein
MKIIPLELMCGLWVKKQFSLHDQLSATLLSLAGCIFAELLNGKPFFPVSSTFFVCQVNLICLIVLFAKLI